MARKRLLTVEEAILLHLLGFLKHSPENDAPLEMTQTGISMALGVRRSHVSTSLDFAKENGTVEEHLSRVKGEKRKRKCYYLTHIGIETARQKMNQVSETHVEADMGGGKRFSGTFRELHASIENSPSQARLALLCNEGRISIPPNTDAAYENPSQPQIPKVGQLVGRDRELDQVGKLFSGDVRILTLTGMPGIGKTWLAAHAASRFGDGAVFWHNTCEWNSTRNLLSHMADFLKGEGHDRLRRYLDTHEVPDLADVHDIILSTPFRIVLVFDDCQSANSGIVSFLKMLASVSSQSSNLGLILVGRNIPEELGKLHVFNHDNVISILLPPLNESSSMQILSARGIPPDRAKEIAARGGGHPLFLSLAGTEASTGEARSLENLLASEIQSIISEEYNAMLRLLSVFREPVASDALVESQNDIKILDGLKERSLIFEQGGWFMHGLLRDFYNARQTPEEKRSHHERAAEHYNRHPVKFADHIEEIHHLFMAGDIESAIMALLARGSEMLARGYVDELLAMCSIMPENWQNRDELLGLNFIKLSAQDLVGKWDDATEGYTECLRMARELGNGDMEAAVLRRLGAIQYRRGNLAEAKHFIENAMELTESPLLIAELHGTLGVILWKLGERESAIKAYEYDLTASRGENEPRGIARALNNLGILDWQTGNHADAMDKYAEALKLAERIHDLKLVAILYSNMGDVQRSLGRFADARRYYERCLALAEDLKFNWQIAEAYRGLAEITPESKRDYLSRALTIFERLGANDDAKTVREMIACTRT